MTTERDDADERTARIDALLEELRLNSNDLAQLSMVGTGSGRDGHPDEAAFARAVRDRATGRTTRVALWTGKGCKAQSSTPSPSQPKRAAE